jgi:hypothetical protein
VMINCRCEGAKVVPAFDFQDIGHITLIGLTTEGRRENPALFRFTNCFHVVAINPGLAMPDEPYSGGKHADGMLFDDCREFTVIQPLARASFTQLSDSGGDYTSRAIRIKNNCRSGTPGTSTWAESRDDGIDWAFAINTRDWPPHTSPTLRFADVARCDADRVRQTLGLYHSSLMVRLLEEHIWQT